MDELSYVPGSLCKIQNLIWTWKNSRIFLIKLDSEKQEILPFSHIKIVPRGFLESPPSKSKSHTGFWFLLSLEGNIWIAAKYFSWISPVSIRERYYIYVWPLVFGRLSTWLPVGQKCEGPMSVICSHCEIVQIDFNCAYTVKSKQASKWLATES